MLTDEACPHRFVHWLKRWVHIGFKHLPACHAGVFLLVRVEGIVELLDVADVVFNQFFPCVVLFVLVGIILLVKHLLGFRAVVSVFGIEASDAEVVSMLHTAFLGTVHRLSVFLLGVHRGAETHKWEQYSCLQETLFPLTHQVVLHLNLRRAAPTLAFYQSEHRTEAVGYQVHVLVAVVGVAHHALACDIVGVVCLRPCLGILQFAWEVAVVE